LVDARRRTSLARPLDELDMCRRLRE
jgi:hypothetical protein